MLKFITHSRRATLIAQEYGWLPGARYTNLRDIRKYERIGLLDIDWKYYNFERHLVAAKETRPFYTVAQDILDKRKFPQIIDEAYALSEYAEKVIVVPKDPELTELFHEAIPKAFIIGFSVPTVYGGTPISPIHFRRPVHLLGGRPDVQRRLAEQMPVVSFDCNRFTLDAEYGDYFNGRLFKPHPRGGYENCIRDSIKNINRIWDDYKWVDQ